MQDYETHKEKALLTPNQVCTILNIRMSKFRSMIFRNELPVIRLGRLLRIDKNELPKWIESKENNL